jgi:hypothetical protein
MIEIQSHGILSALTVRSLCAVIPIDAVGQQATPTPTRLRTLTPELTPEQEESLTHPTLVYLDDGTGNLVNKARRISRVNVQIVNDLGATNGNAADPDSVTSTSVNGVGYLVIGYNEPGNPMGDDWSGSHNLVLGHGNTYSDFGGKGRVP